MDLDADPIAVGHAERLIDARVDIVRGLDQLDVLRCLTGCALDLLVPGVADEDDRVSLGRIALRLRVHLRHERAGRVDLPVPARGRVRVHGRRHAVRREDDHRAVGHLLLAVDEDRAARLEIADDVDVVDDLLAHVDRRAVVLQSELHGVDGALDPGAVTPGRSQQHLLHCQSHSGRSLA